MKLFMYFSQTVGMDILDAQGEYLGALHDLVMNPNSDIYPKATELVLRRGFLQKEYAHIKWENVVYVEDEIRLNIPKVQIIFQKEVPKSDFTLRRDILDQQLVDTDDQRVVRVNDIHLLRVENQLYAAHVDVGLRALVRRLEWTAFIDTIVRLLNSKNPYLTQEDLIPWKNAQVLPKLGRMKSVLKLDVTRNKLAAIPPAALAEIMQDLDIFARVSLFKSLNATIQNKVFTDMDIHFKMELIDQLDESDAAMLLKSISAHEIADFLTKLSTDKIEQLKPYL